MEKIKQQNIEEQELSPCCNARITEETGFCTQCGENVGDEEQPQSNSVS